MAATTTRLDAAALRRLRDRLSTHIERGDLPGIAALVARGDDVHVEVLGTPAFDDPTPLRRDAIFRIASLTKPIAAAGAMGLIEDGVLRLDDPVEEFLPELADRRVMRDPLGPLDDTVPAERSITVEDLLTFRFGFGNLLAPPNSCPLQHAEAELGLMTFGPPWPPSPLTSDEWLARFATLPLMEQPGAAWRYNTAAQVLGILLERAVGQPLEAVLRRRILEPLGMHDTAFSVPDDKQERLTTAYIPDLATGETQLLDPPRGGWWNKPPAMANACGMLVSTLDDMWSFAAMLRAGGSHRGTQVLSLQSVAAMTRNHLTDEQRAAATPFLGEHGGWGYGMAAPGPISGEPPVPWGYGWTGGTGTAWFTDPVRGLTTILMTQRAMTSPDAPTIYTDFWDAAYAAIPS